jgi:O-antigen ligase
MLVKYYPKIGIQYDQYVGAPEYVGATTSKNMLGALCLTSGLFYFWDILGRWSKRKTREGKWLLFANVMFFAIALRLLMLSNSATSRGCLIMGCLIMMIVRSNWAKANPRLVNAAIPAALAGYVVAEYVLGLSSMVAELFGRDPTLTGRTGIWDAVLKVHTNPLFGVGYQTFWIGDRLAAVWNTLHTSYLNEAHNGYLETYLNLGYIGVALLVAFMFSSGRTACRQLVASSHFASFAIALWMVTIFYNFTEVAFGASLLWFVLLLCVLIVPRSHEVLSKGKESVVKGRTATVHSRGSEQLAPSSAIFNGPRRDRRLHGLVKKNSVNTMEKI